MLPNHKGGTISINPKLQKLNQEHFRELIRKNAEELTSADPCGGFLNLKK